MTDKARVVFIAGPTASGKSALALALAERTGGEIVNADAIQVYRDLEILSARPAAGETARARAHLFGHVDAAERYSAGRFAREAGQAVAEITARGRMAVVVGGTGLYFRALEGLLSPIPEIPEDVREKGRRRLGALGLSAFADEVGARDPESARAYAGDPQRLLRAWSVHEATGRALSALKRVKGAALTPPPAARIIIEPERRALYDAIERRVDSMLAQGGIEEARRLAQRRLDASLPAMKALAAAEFMAYLKGALTLDAAVDLAKRNTRRFAKRQLTWFRHQAADWERAARPDAALERIEARLRAWAPYVTA